MIFTEQIARKPDNYSWTQEYIEAMWKGHWTPNEFDFQADIQDFKTQLNVKEQSVIKNTLSAIGQIEIAVKKFWARLGDNLPHPSLVDLGLVMANIEVIHNIAYEKLLNVLGLEKIFEENLKLDIIKGRVNYLRKYGDKKYPDSQKKQYIYSLILFTLFVENVSLFSQFYIILWFNRFNNVLKDTAQQVQYTKNEETLHAQAGIKIIQTIKKEYPELFDQELMDRISNESVEAFNAESKIIDWMLGDYEGEFLDKIILKEYVKNRINESLEQIGFDKIFDIDKIILEKTYWMQEEILGNSSTDFFYKKPTEYSKKGKVFNESDIFG
jgi:ribonucleoside-diphosphate reductase beta chain